MWTVSSVVIVTVITFSCRGSFSFGFGPLVTKCEISGLKKPAIVVHPKLGRDCAKVRTYPVDGNPSSKKSTFNDEDPSGKSD
jgi:hypothetical protein